MGNVPVLDRCDVGGGDSGAAAWNQRGAIARAAVVVDRRFRSRRNKMPRASIPEPRPRCFDADHALGASADPVAIACSTDRNGAQVRAHDERAAKNPHADTMRAENFFRYLDVHRKCGDPLRSGCRDVTNSIGVDIRIGIGIEGFCGRGFNPDALFSDRCETSQLLSEKRRG
ncbi:hypothetical protein KME82_25945 [Lysobacter capsici]|nr:hypothetical protein [Lysobacter capsici]QWF17125.1 hypothetical protein KME82_25945 [Lysobacter capsici]